MAKDSVFEKAVNHYLKSRSSQNQEAMVSALIELLTTNSSNLETAKDARNTGVKKRLSGFLEKDIPEIIKKEELFSVYLDFLDNIYKDDFFSDQRDVIVSSLHECWGLWLLMYFNEEKSTEKSTSLKEQLKVDLLSAKQNILSKQSPSSMVYYYIRSGNNLREKGHLTESIEMFTKALEDGASGEIIPLYNRALATIMKKDIDYIAQALADLEKADKAIDSYKSHLAHILTCVKSSRQDMTAEGSKGEREGEGKGGGRREGGGGGEEEEEGSREKMKEEYGEEEEKEKDEDEEEDDNMEEKEEGQGQENKQSQMPGLDQACKRILPPLPDQGQYRRDAGAE
ncbi:hypothetical protein G5714_008699 [Onychostoma macrolepis]|uniref:Uncharacterized protein n=1 Tax=Onychostoma macrolepis TaxID=369639 RepID=A0A7J6CWE7_9TELE|nr:hypothetical protein G5714_008699 [Onychostoma macrolepis]